MAVVLFVHPGHFSAWSFFIIIILFFCTVPFLSLLIIYFLKKSFPFALHHFCFPWERRSCFSAGHVALVFLIFISLVLTWNILFAPPSLFILRRAQIILFFFFFSFFFSPLSGPFASPSKVVGARRRRGKVADVGGRRTETLNNRKAVLSPNSHFFRIFFRFFRYFFWGGGVFFTSTRFHSSGPAGSNILIRYSILSFLIGWPSTSSLLLGPQVSKLSTFLVAMKGNRSSFLTASNVAAVFVCFVVFFVEFLPWIVLTREPRWFVVFLLFFSFFCCLFFGGFSPFRVPDILVRLSKRHRAVDPFPKPTKTQ